MVKFASVVPVRIPKFSFSEFFQVGFSSLIQLQSSGLESGLQWGHSVLDVTDYVCMLTSRHLGLR